MPRELTFRQLLLSILALRYDRSQKEIGAAAGIAPKRISQYLTRGEIKEEVFDRLLAALKCRQAAVRTVTACLESLEALERDGVLTEAERDEVESGVLMAARLVREELTRAALFSRTHPAPGYPGSGEVRFYRERAEELWKRLKDLPEESRSAVVRIAGEFQSWALCERVCAESVTEASRKVERAAGLARLAGEIAEEVRGPEGWRERLRGYAAAHAANVLRVSGDLRAADTAFERAKHLWRAGSDPASVLDPGRLPDLEASLRRDQRRFEEALLLLDETATVGRAPARALINKGFTLEVMGEYERAVETLLQAAPLVERQGDPRLLYMLRFNLAVNFCHAGRYAEGTKLIQQVRELATALGDEVFLLRVIWLEGRIAAGVGHSWEARGLLAQARREFGRRGLSYDVALALLEEAALLLDENKLAEVKALARELTGVFAANGVHLEALAALRLFQDAAERETATAEFARRVLRYLDRARYDQGLRFKPS
ncbi:MAG TPA: hypothetical protein VKK31_17470 [Thermoanaerobaculia bacterium]|nr:hypothetical protein [Thermoanaerobaculia bacterium]